METAKLILTIIQLLTAVFVVVMVLMQTGKSNGLSAAFGDKLSKDQLRQAIADTGLPEGVRGEKLGIPEFAALAHAIQALEG